jgi:hypothetical protein
MNDKKRFDISDVKFIKPVVVGSVNPNIILSDDARQSQIAFVNRCLNDYPKGIIIGKDIAIGRYTTGDYELVMQRTTYHIGFPRKPAWMEGL